jgi:succinyl-CoA synthetase beta subunit
MNIHEYQAKELLRGFGAPVPQGIAVFSVGEAKEAAETLGGPVWVVKSQIHAGGRGKGRFKEAEAGEKGGVRLAKSVDEVVSEVEKMLGRTLVTHQTGPAGRPVNRLYIEEGSEIERELYLSILVDRATSRIALIASEAGGMNIEEVAAETPEKIVTVHVDPAAGYAPHLGRRLAFGLGLSGPQIAACDKLIGTLYKAFVEKDMSLLEVNPLVVTKSGSLVCLDAKINFDDNALFRHPDVAALRDPG